MAGIFVFCDPSFAATNKCQAVYYDQATGNTVGNIFGNCSAILGGIPAAAPTNNNNGDLSVILMGFHNCINIFSGASNGIYNTIANGFCNVIGGNSPTGTSPARGSSILGGICHCIDTDIAIETCHSSIGGGVLNYIGIGANNSFIGGGTNNQASGLNSFIGGGDINQATSACSFVGGGHNNVAGNIFATIVGGENNNVAGAASFIGGGAANTIDANPHAPCCAAIVGGQLNNIGNTTGPIINSDYSFIGGGYTNNIFGNQSVITGGGNHCVNGNNMFIGGGDTNFIGISSDCSFLGGGSVNNIGAVLGSGAGSVFSVIGGGQSNCIDDTGTPSPYNIISGGQGNTIYAGSSYSGVFGGCNHCAAGFNLFIGGGDTNVIYSTLGLVNDSVIAGGQGSLICDDGTRTADFSFIGGGITNNIFSIGSSIAGGIDNGITGNSVLCLFGPCIGVSFIGSGCNNQINGAGSFIGGGDTNKICNGATLVNLSSIAGGNHNTITGSTSSIGGGEGNIIGGISSSVGGGENNCIYSLLGDIVSSVIAGGSGNYIYDNGSDPATGAFIGGGAQNCIQGLFSVVAGGEVNQTWGANSVVVGGSTNKVCGQFSFIGGGFTNLVNQSSDNSFIGGGSQNSINQYSCWSFIGGGICNNIGAVAGGGYGFCGSFIGGGAFNCMDDSAYGSSFYNSIVGGQYNCICASTFCSSIVGGARHVVDAGSEYSFIGGGNRNHIGITGGSYATQGSTIAGGTSNCIISNNSFIGGGNTNAINPGSDCSFISGGQNNSIGLGGAGSIFGAIGGGYGNVIDDTGMIPTSYGVIGGGLNNCICAGTNHASIFSGNGNTVAGDCSSILGGSGNSDGGFNYVGIFGQNVTGVMNNAFHMEELVLQNIPVDTSATGSGAYSLLPNGALYTTAAPGAGFKLRPIYIK